MSTLKSYSSIFTVEHLEQLRCRNIITILEFLQEPPDNIIKIMNLRFKDILEMKEKLQHLFKGYINSALQIYSGELSICRNIPCGTLIIDQILAELESSTVYELCGLSGSGKTQICLGISACMAFAGQEVHYIDTKNEFSSRKVLQVVNNRDGWKKDALDCLDRIVVTKVDNLYHLINVLHELKIRLAGESVPLIIIDCISTLYFETLGLEGNRGLALLNHIALIIKFFKTEFQTTFILTNLAAKCAEKTSSDKMKPYLGNYWSQVCDTRIVMRKTMNSARFSSIDKDNRVFNLDLSGV